MDKPHDCVKQVEGNENAITYASHAFREPGAKAISVSKVAPNAENVRSGNYPYSRPLVILSKDIPSGDVKTFYDFALSPEGQAIVARKFVSAH